MHTNLAAQDRSVVIDGAQTGANHGFGLNNVVRLQTILWHQPPFHVFHVFANNTIVKPSATACTATRQHTDVTGVPCVCMCVRECEGHEPSQTHGTCWLLYAYSLQTYGDVSSGSLNAVLHAPSRKRARRMQHTRPLGPSLVATAIRGPVTPALQDLVAIERRLPQQLVDLVVDPA